MKHPVNIRHHLDAHFGERLADRIASGIGSWRFLIIQTFLVCMWVTLNIVGLFAFRWDAYPFILLNLLFSVQAAYTGPVLLLASNRQASKDRLMAEHDYQTNVDAHKLIESLLAELEKNTKITQSILESHAPRT